MSTTGKTDAAEAVGRTPNYSKALEEWLPIREAARRLATINNLDPDTVDLYETVKAAARRRRHRMEGRDKDTEPANPEKADTDETQRPDELVYVTFNTGFRRTYLIWEPSLNRYKLNVPGAGGGGRYMPGRPIGSGKPRKKAEATAAPKGAKKAPRKPAK